MLTGAPNKLHNSPVLRCFIVADLFAPVDEEIILFQMIFLQTTMLNTNHAFQLWMWHAGPLTLRAFVSNQTVTFSTWSFRHPSLCLTGISRYYTDRFQPVPNQEAQKKQLNIYRYRYIHLRALIWMYRYRYLYIYIYICVVDYARTLYTVICRCLCLLVQCSYI